MKKVLPILVFLLTVGQAADCMTVMRVAYEVGQGNVGGAMNQQHAIRICEVQLPIAGIKPDDGTMKACLMGVNSNPMQKNLPRLINEVCYSNGY
jgi:hypothetical protein